MSEKQVKITVANRAYPLKVKIEEEEIVSQAQNLITQYITELEKSYAINDKQDLLSMCLIKVATEFSRLKNEKESVAQTWNDNLDKAVSKISDHLKSTSVL